MTKESHVESPMASHTNVVECVGSLLLPAHELQELSEHHESPTSPVAPDREVVGSILLPPLELPTNAQNVGEPTKKEPFMARLQKRITKDLQTPPPEDVPDFWFY